EAALGDVLELDEVVLGDAAHAVAGAEDALDAVDAAESLDDADERLVDDDGGSAGLSDDGVAAHDRLRAHAIFLPWLLVLMKSAIVRRGRAMCAAGGVGEAHRGCGAIGSSPGVRRRGRGWSRRGVGRRP